MISRIIKTHLETRLFQGKAILLYGARQTGKTTLVKELLKDHEGLYFNADEPDIRAKFSGKSSSELKTLIGRSTFVVIDEAQRIENIGLVLKLLQDTYPEIQLMATGSSSFELADRIKEPLTGRKFEFHLSPLSMEEIEQHTGSLETDRLLMHRILYGGYPEIAFHGADESRERLMEVAGSYLYKDVLLLGGIRHPDALEKLLRALALQVGQEISVHELSGLVGLDKNTVQTYIRILEQAFILFKLPPFSRNLRNELKKRYKVYFWDTGIRNAVINTFTSLENRTDAGALFENFIIAERRKQILNHRSQNPSYFWRTHNQQEIDYVEDQSGTLFAAEIKLQPRKVRIPKTFVTAYPDSVTNSTGPENWRDVVYAPLTQA